MTSGMDPSLPNPAQATPTPAGKFSTRRVSLIVGAILSVALTVGTASALLANTSSAVASPAIAAAPTSTTAPVPTTVPAPDPAPIAAPAPSPAPAQVVSAAGPFIGSGASCGAPGGPPDAVTSTIFQRTNADRAANGLGALVWNPQLYCLAIDWSTQLGNSGTFDHRDLNSVLHSGAFAGYTALGENLLRAGASVDGNQMEDAWLNSPGHRANIMQGAYTSFGIAVYYVNGQVYATVNFGE